MNGEAGETLGEEYAEYHRYPNALPFIISGTTSFSPTLDCSRILVCGSRVYDDWKSMYDILYLFRDEEVHWCHGGAKGADSMAGTIIEYLRKSLGLKLTWMLDIYPAFWGAEGPSALPKRNQRMIDGHKPTLVIAFKSPGGGGVGTNDMIKRATKAGVPVWEP